MTTIEIPFVPVKRSDTLDAVAYFEEPRDLLVRFKKNGSVYLYKDADPSLFNHLVNTPHPWSKFRTVVQELQYEKLSSGLRTEPLKRKPAPKVAAPAAAVDEKHAEIVVKKSPGRPRKDGTPAQARVKVSEPAPVAEEKPKAARKPRVTAKKKESEMTEAEKEAVVAKIFAEQKKAPKL